MKNDIEAFEVSNRDVVAFAYKFRSAFEREGVVALDRFEWMEGFLELGFEMDCGGSLEDRCGIKPGDDPSDLARVNDTRVLGNAIFSQCRYLTHWSGGYGEEHVEWLSSALARMEELSREQLDSGATVSRSSTTDERR